MSVLHLIKCNASDKDNKPYTRFLSLTYSQYMRHAKDVIKSWNVQGRGKYGYSIVGMMENGTLFLHPDITEEATKQHLIEIANQGAQKHGFKLVSTHMNATTWAF